MSLAVWAVCGRIPGDDDDTLLLVECDTDSNPNIQFVEQLYLSRGEHLPVGWCDVDGFEDAALLSAHGLDAWAYITGSVCVERAMTERERAIVLDALRAAYLVVSSVAAPSGVAMPSLAELAALMEKVKQ